MTDMTKPQRREGFLKNTALTLGMRRDMFCSDMKGSDEVKDDLRDVVAIPGRAISR
jgi:hypothetical protein